MFSTTARSTAPAYALLRYLTADVQAFLEEAAGALPLGGYEKVDVCFSWRILKPIAGRKFCVRIERHSCTMEY